MAILKIKRMRSYHYIMNSKERNFAIKCHKSGEKYICNVQIFVR